MRAIDGASLLFCISLRESSNFLKSIVFHIRIPAVLILSLRLKIVNIEYTNTIHSMHFVVFVSSISYMRYPYAFSLILILSHLDLNYFPISGFSIACCGYVSKLSVKVV